MCLILLSLATSASMFGCVKFLLSVTLLCVFCEAPLCFIRVGRWQNPDAAVREAVGLLQAYRAETSRSDRDGG